MEPSEKIDIEEVSNKIMDSIESVLVNLPKNYRKKCKQRIKKSLPV